MPTGKPMREEDKQALLDLVSAEIQAHREGRSEKLTGNLELTDLLGISKRNLIGHLKYLPQPELSYRSNILRVQNGKKCFEMHGSPIVRLSIEERRAIGRKFGVIGGKICGQITSKLLRKQRM